MKNLGTSKFILITVVALLTLSCGENSPSFDERTTIMSADGSVISIVNGDDLLPGESSSGDQSSDAMGDEPTVEINDEAPVEESSDSADTESEEPQSDDSASTDDGETPVGEDPIDPPTIEELSDCGLKFSKNIKRIIVAGSKKQINVDADSVLAIRITGNQNRVDIKTLSEANIGGLCFFLAGNQSQMSLTIDQASVGALFYRARGNQTSGEVLVNKDAKLNHTKVDLGGNNTKLSISGDGDYSCPSIKQKNGKASKSELICQ
jgi:hypothetical protein